MHTVNVKVGTNDRRDNVLVPSNSTIRTILEDNQVSYEVATVYLDGASLNPGDLDKTLDDFNIADNCYLVAVVKTSNA